MAEGQDRGRSVPAGTRRAGAGRPRRLRGARLAAVALLAVLVPAFLLTLAFAGAASAATTSPAAPATPAAAAAADATGPCAIPLVGDLGSLAGLCNAGSGAVGDLNNICSPGTPQPEQATAGIDSMIDVPGGTTGGKTLYDQYGVAGQTWNATNLQCSDMTSLIGNQIANVTFNFAKTLDRLTITVYQSAAGNDILNWLSGSVDRLVSALGNAIYFPYLAPVVLLGAAWLAWQGLVRKRATRTVEGTIWMVFACVAAIWLIGRPADFTGVGTTVSNSVTNVMNVAFAKLPAPQGAGCLPVGASDPQSVSPDYAFTSGNGLVDENADELWSVLVCKPWVLGEFGTTQFGATASQPQTVVNAYGRQLLWAQAVAANEQPTPSLVQQKQDVYQGIASQMQASFPATYPLFQGDQWTTRLEIGFGALFAAVVAGLLVLLIALTLILLKLGFLLLLVAGPFFLIIGTHPGFGRIVAIRWFEMLVGVLLKQVAVALTLSVLLYCYSLIMGTSDQTLPWALKIIMIALVTVAVFIYRKPFAHLFSSVGYGMLGAEERAGVSLREATFGFRRATAGGAGLAGAVAGSVVPGPGTALGSRWARRFGESAAGEATAGGTAAAAAAAAAGGVRGSAHGTAGGTRSPSSAAPDRAPAAQQADGEPAAGARRRQWPNAGGYRGSSRPAPPPLPGRGGSGGTTAGWARGRDTGPLPRVAGSPPASSRPAAPAGQAKQPVAKQPAAARQGPPAAPPAVRQPPAATPARSRPFWRGR